MKSISRLKKIAKICVCVFCYNIFLCSSIISKKYLSMLEKLEREREKRELFLNVDWGKKGGYIYKKKKKCIFAFVNFLQ